MSAILLTSLGCLGVLANLSLMIVIAVKQPLTRSNFWQSLNFYIKSFTGFDLQFFPVNSSGVNCFEKTGEKTNFCVINLPVTCYVMVLSHKDDAQSPPDNNL